MKNHRIIFLTIPFLFLSCCTNKTNRTTAEVDSIFTNRLNLILSDLGNLRLNDIQLREQEWGGVENTPDYKLGIGESYYPNPNKYEIDTVIVYLINENSLIENSITHYATKDSGLIRVIFLEWKEPFLINPNLQKKADETFRNILTFLEDNIVQEAGKHIEYKEEKNYIDRIWKTSSGFTITLENMKNFNRIRMVIYKD